MENEIHTHKIAKGKEAYLPNKEEFPREGGKFTEEDQRTFNEIKEILRRTFFG